MKQHATPAFQLERGRFRLRFTCEYCTYFDVDRERCTHGYPNAAHREGRSEGPDAALLFCKDFELM